VGFGKIKQDIYSNAIAEPVNNIRTPVGYLRLHNISRLKTIEGDSCELIGISEGTFIDPKRAGRLLCQGNPVEWTIREGENSSGEASTNGVFYNLIWVGWNKSIKTLDIVKA
jgi:hypothetical protein